MTKQTVMQKLQAKQSKKGFTLVELVIAIAIIAILASIAIPVIISTINSADKSTLESDAATIEMMVKACVNEAKAKVGTDYNGKVAGTDAVALSDIFTENDFHLQATKGNFVMTMDTNGNVTVEDASAPTGTTFTDATEISPTGVITIQ